METLFYKGPQDPDPAKNPLKLQPVSNCTVQQLLEIPGFVKGSNTFDVV